MHCDDMLGLTVRLEDNNNRFLNKLKKVHLITEHIYKHLFVSGSAPGILYGLPKVHKDGIPLCLILAAYNIAMYKLAKFLIPFIEQFAVYEYTLEYTN